MYVPRAKLLITHFKVLEGDLEPVPKKKEVNKRNFFVGGLCCSNDENNPVSY